MKVILLLRGTGVVRSICSQPGFDEAFKAITGKISAQAGVAMEAPERWKK